MFLAVIALYYASLVSQWSCGHFLKLLVQFYLENTISLRHLTQRTVSCHTHKMAIVPWPQSLRRHFPRVWHLVSCRTTVEFSQEHAASSQRSNQYDDISRGRPPEYQTCGPGPSWAPSALSDLELVELQWWIAKIWVSRVVHRSILCDPIQPNPSADWPNPNQLITTGKTWTQPDPTRTNTNCHWLTLSLCYFL